MYKQSLSDYFWKLFVLPRRDVAGLARDLVIAAQHNHQWRARFLIAERGVKPDVQDNAAIKAAAAAGNSEMILLLKSFGADVNASGGAPLLAAVQNRQRNAVNTLVKAGADISQGGHAALYAADAGGDTKIISSLLYSGQDLRVPATGLLKKALHDDKQAKTVLYTVYLAEHPDPAALLRSRPPQWSLPKGHLPEWKFKPPAP